MRPTAKKLLAESGIQALLLTDPFTISYLSGFQADGAVLLAATTGFTLYVSVLEIEVARQHVRASIAVRNLTDLPARLKRVPVCGFEEEHVTVARLKRWKKHFSGTAFKAVSGVVASFRRTKDAEEMKAILKANAITEDILKRLPGILKSGVTEKEISSTIESWARLAGAEKMGFETIVAFGPNTSRPHHRPTDRRLKKRDIIQIDMGVVIDGYTSDRSAVYFAGEPTKEQQKTFMILNEAMEKGIHAIAPGVRASDVDAVVRNHLKQYKLDRYFIHSTGHGVGLEVHEGVGLSSRSDDILLDGEVVTVEPGVYFPGKWGMRVEEMVFV